MTFSGFTLPMSYSTTDLQATIVALSTPPGTGALAVIRLSGARAIGLTDRFFRSKDLTLQATHTLHVGNLRAADGRILDEVVIGLFRGPRSYTGEDVVEISTHGSPYIVREVLRLFADNGARPAQPGEFTLRAFLNGRLDLSQAEAVGDLIASESRTGHELAMRQMRGGFSRRIAELRQQLIDFAALIELELDFGEEDVEFANRKKLRELIGTIRRVLRDLIDSFALGNVLRTGVPTVLAGRPNAGKSTLLNALLAEDRALVSDIAGTTRDTIEEGLVIDGIQFRLIDTAGIREAQDQIEAAGVARTLEKVAESSLLLYVFDVIDTQPSEVAADLEKLYRPGLTIFGVANKMDLNPYTEAKHYAGPHLPPERFIPLSARNNMNIPYLKERLHAAVLGDAELQDQTVVTNARHVAALQQADQALGTALENMDTGITADWIALDIRRALHHLGEITGEISTDDLLGSIFGRFCIGK